jgi:TonB family protein
VVVPYPKPFRSEKKRSLTSPETSPQTSPQTSPTTSADRSSGVSENLDESSALSSLKKLIAAGDHRLDPILETIADAARRLTSASGAALAMWKDGAMVCRARSGKTAPALGVRLSADTGISGECLRTGKTQHCTDSEHNPLVDAEVCRSLGLRSIAVSPIQGWREINGILEVFSTQPGAFTEAHIVLLEQLATLAERARATQPRDASPTAPKRPSTGKAKPSGLLPASDRVGDVALAFIGTGRRSRALVLGVIGLVAISLMALVIWLGWRGADEADAKSRAVPPASIGSSSITTVTANSPGHVNDRDSVLKPNPGGELLYASRGKPPAGAPVKFASKVDVITVKRTPLDRLSAPTDSAVKVNDGVANNAAMPQAAPNLQLESRSESPPNGSRPPDSDSNNAASSEPPQITATVTNPSSLNTVLSSETSVPALSPPISIGVSGGQLLYRTMPVYPSQARQQRLEGTVVLNVTVMEDGSSGEIKVVKGSPILARSAMDAMKNWRYQPFQLDGKPIQGETKITISFKFPK